MITPVVPRRRIAVLGLGSMGLPMAVRLAGQHAVRGFDVAPQRLALAERDAVTPCPDPAAAVRDCEIIVAAVRDQRQLDQTLFGDAGAAGALVPDALLLITSTIGPEAVVATAERLRSVAPTVAVVDCPVSGGPTRAGTGELSIFVGAAPEAVGRARPVLDRLGSSITVVGARPGDGQLLKVINQLLAGVHIAAAAEALALARSVGLDPTTVLAALSTGAGASFMFGDRGPRIVEAFDDDPEVRSRVDIFVKDMGLVARTAEHAGLRLPVAAAARALYDAAQDAGLGGQDDSTIVRLLLPDRPADDVD